MRIGVFIIIAFTFLNNCGFQAIYKTDVGDGTNYENRLAAVQISGERKRIYQKLNNNLEEILNPNKIQVEKEYILDIKITKHISTTFISATGSSGRNKLTLEADYVLKRILDDEIIATGNATAKDDFDVGSKRFANYIVEEEMELNLTELIAQNIRDSLINDLFKSQYNSEETVDTQEIVED